MPKYIRIWKTLSHALLFDHPRTEAAKLRGAIYKEGSRATRFEPTGAANFRICTFKQLEYSYGYAWRCLKAHISKIMLAQNG